MTALEALERGRASFARRAWAEAYAQLSIAAADGALELDDLEHLALTAELVGRGEEGSEHLARAHQAALAAGDPARAALDAFWLGFGLINRGEYARGGGWLARARSLVADGGLDAVVTGYLELPGALQAMDQGDAQASYDGFERAGEVGARFGDPDLQTLSRLGRGTALVRLGEHERGAAFLDEAMVAVVTSEVSPIVAGIVYCATIEACQDMFDLRRAQEWTAALTRWCETQPDIVSFRGRCLLYRAELLQFHGAWGDADVEAQKAFIRLSAPPPEPAVGAAYYQQAELHRLRGEFDAAEERYRDGTAWGRPPEPGLALLHLARGDLEGALGIIRRSLTEPRDPAARTRLLEPAVEILLAYDDIDGARTIVDELTTSAEMAHAPLLTAIATRCAGALRLAADDAAGALPLLRSAWSAWQGLEAPYEVARTSVLIGLACRDFGDEATATMEFDAARRVFAELGATPDIARVDALAGTSRTRPADAGAAAAVAAGLTARELEVLRLVAAGRSNRAIAETLVISEKTVARHVSNIFDKLDVSSRSAATAYAYEHGLVGSST